MPWCDPRGWWLTVHSETLGFRNPPAPVIQAIAPDLHRSGSMWLAAEAILYADAETNAIRTVNESGMEGRVFPSRLIVNPTAHHIHSPQEQLFLTETRTLSLCSLNTKTGAMTQRYRSATEILDLVFSPDPNLSSAQSLFMARMGRIHKR